MAIRYHYDLYPRTDPRDGARVTRFAHLQQARYEDVIGVGSGVGVIRSSIAEADHLDPRGEQYVRVVRRDTTAETELVVGGFWVNRYNHDTAVARETKRLTFAGAGHMAYLARARMAPHTYMWELDNDFVPQDPFDDIWRLWNQGDWAGGDFLGAVFWRVIQEALHYRTGSTYTHRHKDGETYTDGHDDDRTATQGSAIEFVTLGFDQFEDSNGNAWTVPSGEFQASVGENVLSVTRRLMQAGLNVRMDPDTFELNAWEGRPAAMFGRSTDRTGPAWATGVVRFQAPTDATVDTGNMLSDSEREINSHLPRHLVWVGGGDVYARAIAPIGNGIRWEGFEPSTATDEDALAQIGAAQITAREEAADAGLIRMKLGTTQSQGRYRPWEEVRLDDLVTVHTGTGEWDYDEATYPVAGLKIELQKSGAWHAWAELGASFSPGADRRFQVAPAAAHSHPPNPQLCRPMSGASEPTVLFRYTSLTDVMTADVTPDAAWDVTSDAAAAEHALTTTPTSTRDHALSTTARNDVLLNTFAFQLDAASAAIIAAGGATILMHARARTRAGIGVDESAQEVIGQMVVRVTAGDSTTIRGTALAAHSLASTAGSTKWAQSSTYTNRPFPPEAATNVLSAVGATVAGDYLVIEVGCRNFTTNPPAATGAHIWFNDQAGAVGDLPADVTTTWNGRSWIQITGSGGAGVGDGHIDLVGTSVRASRCDHRHDVHRDRAPTASDDGSLGYRLGTLWAQLDDLDDPTAILGVWMLVDTTTGAAVWLSITSSTAAPSLDELSDVVIDSLADDDDLRYSAAAGHWINDPRKWEAVTDGEDVFVWEDDDLVHEWNGAP
jgi:hypothetical protein